MKKFIFYLLLLLCSKSFSQGDLHCATDQIMQQHFVNHPGVEAKLKLHELQQKKSFANKSALASYTIPIVFHILHLGGPENIADSQVVDGLRILNRDFALKNADTSEIIPSMLQIADSTGVKFALATKDPNGNCTNGIVHHFDTDADWNDASPTLYSHTWDPTQYLNVYIVRTITLGSGFGAAGYTYFPGSFSPGDPMDAIVVLNNYFGSVGTGSAFQSRVLTHEVGHWLNLLHVFGFNGAAIDCSGDDYVNDTPTTPGYLICPDINNPASYQICTPGIDENFQNYMDYSYCCKMFTHEQGQRMQLALNDNIAGRDNLWSASNLIATGVSNPILTCIPEADFKFSRSTTCVGVPVTFTDASTNGQPTNYTWTFPSGTPSTSNSASPSVTYSAPGLYSATLVSGNAAGNSVAVSKLNCITVTNTSATYVATFNWTEGFETAALPNADWNLSNSSGGANWAQTSDAFSSGAYSAKLSSQNNTRKNVSSMTGPSIDLSGNNGPMLYFALAAAEVNPNHINNLSVYASTDCEQTWSQIYSKTGAALVTTQDSVVPFIPLSLSQWRYEAISLLNFSGASYFKLKFVYTRDTLPGAANIYIDDIFIDNFTGVRDINLVPAIELYPNPAFGQSKLEVKVATKSEIKITVRDLFGRLVEPIVQQSIHPGITGIMLGEKSPLQKGVYAVVVTLNEHTITKMLVIQ